MPKKYCNIFIKDKCLNTKQSTSISNISKDFYISNEDINQINGAYENIFNDFSKIDKSTSYIYNYNKIERKKKRLETKLFLENKLHSFLDEVANLNFKEINDNLVQLDVDNLFGNAKENTDFNLQCSSKLISNEMDSAKYLLKIDKDDKNDEIINFINHLANDN